MAMNTSKVVVGGLISGIIIVVIDFILNAVVFASRMKAEMDAFKPGLSDAMNNSTAMWTFIICDLVIGLILIWTYAAIRPRFGPGPKTAVTAALMVWITAGVLMSNYLMIGMMSMGSWWLYAICWLVNLLIATVIGARFYTEEGAPATV
jgi:heme/copper-type cytochrome/quinol oxidase subunit 3